MEDDFVCSVVAAMGAREKEVRRSEGRTLRDPFVI